jgi:hypothetical protein
MERNNKQNWEKDFLYFASCEETSIPEALGENVLKTISDELHPSAIKVFGKLTLVTFLVGAITLLFCPQFGVSLTSSMGLMYYLMPLGSTVCFVGCGGFFVGASIFIASLILKPEEILSLKEHAVLQLLSLSLLSLGALLCLGGEVVLTLGLVWALGAVVAGGLSLEAGWFLRKKAATGF